MGRPAIERILFGTARSFEWATPSLLRWGPRSSDVWRATLLASPTQQRALAGLLSADEHSRASRFHFARDRRRYTVSRALLRLLLARYLERPARQIEFDYSEQGKPLLRTGSTKDELSFNLSHSEDLVVYAIARTPAIGVDVEHVRPHVDVDALAQVVLTPAEQEILRRVRQADRHRSFVVLWTLKEAYLKALGLGLSLPPRSVDLTTAEPASAACAIRLPGPNGTTFICTLLAAEEYALALAVSGEAEIRCYDWTWAQHAMPDA